MKKTWPITIDCPNCAAKLEAALNKVPGVTSATVNYVHKRFTLEATDADFDAVLSVVLAKAHDIEPDTVIHVDNKHESVHKQHEEHAPGHHHHDHDGCTCGHDHEHHDHCSCGHDHHDHAHQHECGCEKHSGHEHHDHHGHTHDHGSAKGSALLWRVGVSVVLLILSFLVGAPVLSAILVVLAYLVAGYDVLGNALRNILRGQVFDENFLMTVASLGALLMGEGAEAVAVMALYQVGEYFQDKAVDKSRESITALMDVRPDAAAVLRDGEYVTMRPEDVAIGETIRVLPGEKVPLDGVILTGETALDTAALTGESLPRDVCPGDSVLSGCVNGHGAITLRVTAAYGESTVAKILELVESSADQKAQTERFITRFARVYTPVVCLLAVLLCVIPGVVTGEWMHWLYQALTFLVISCPCALVISVPLAYFAGIGAQSRQGVLVKGANYIELLAKMDTVAFDKTGTLTRGVFRVTDVSPVNMASDDLLALAAHAESCSNHPISRSLQTAYGADIDEGRIAGAQEIPGHGVRATVDGRVILAGNARWMQENDVAYEAVQAVGTVVHVAADGAYAGHIVISDEMKPTTAGAIAGLKAEGVSRLVMLTGDSEAVARAIGEAAGVTDVRASLLPGDKVAALEGLLGEGRHVAFVGDGVNDAPVLRRADLGVAMGGLGADAAIEAADVVLMNDDLMTLPRAVKLAKKTMRIVRQNIAMALGFKGVIMVMGLFGMANMWLAVFADVGVAMLAILNAIRVGKR